MGVIRFLILLALLALFGVTGNFVATTVNTREYHPHVHSATPAPSPATPGANSHDTHTSVRDSVLAYAPVEEVAGSTTGEDCMHASQEHHSARHLDTCNGHVAIVTAFQKSHIIALQGLAEEFLSRNYRVTFTLTVEDRHLIKDPRIEFVSGGHDPNPHSHYGYTKEAPDLFRGQADFANSMLPHVLSFYQEIGNTPDIVVSDYVCPLGVGLANILDVPNVDVAVGALSIEYFGTEPITHPTVITSFKASEMTIVQRLLNFSLKNVFRFVLPTIRGFFWSDFLTLCGLPSYYTNEGNLKGKTSLLISAGSWVMEVPQPLPPMVQVVGPFLPRTTVPLALTQPVASEWIDSLLERTSGKHGRGFIYIALGTNAEWTTSLARSFVQAFSQIDAPILWSMKPYQQDLIFSEETGLSKPDPNESNVMLLPFVDQFAVLQDSRLSLFITHCGWNSAQESIFSGIPMIAVPMFGDQFTNGARMEEMGLAQVINKDDTSADDIKDKIGYILSDDDGDMSLVNNAKMYAKITQRMKGKARAADIIENVIEFGGVDYMVEPKENLPFFLKHNLDIYVVVAVAGTILYKVMLKKLVYERLWHTARGRNDGAWTKSMKKD